MQVCSAVKTLAMTKTMKILHDVKNLTQKVPKFVESAHPLKMLLILILFLLALGFNNRFIQDDAFISFRYAENFANGHGLIYNIGYEPVQGYTNFLWTLLISIGSYLNLELISWSMVLGFIFAPGTLFFTYYTSFKVTKSRFAAYLSVFLLGTNYTYSSYITGGMETQLQAFLVIVSVYISLFLLDKNSNVKTGRMWYLMLSVLFSLAAMTRLDSILLCGMLFLTISYSLYTSQEELKEKVDKFVCLSLPSILIVGLWLFSTYLYYGDILPNTYYLKVYDISSEFGVLALLRGVYYVVSFFIGYGLSFFILAGIFYFRKVLFEYKFTTLFAVMVSVWVLYIIRVSGDFMEYRFFVPIMPLIYILFTSALISLVPNFKGRIIPVVFLLIMSLYHAVTFSSTRSLFGIESISALNKYVVGNEYHDEWQTVGRVLGNIFADAKPSSVIIATGTGAIPYHSKLTNIDVLGLNEKWVARNGIVIGYRPGHTRHAPIKYLIDSKVDLVIGATWGHLRPVVKPIDAPVRRKLEDFFIVDKHSFPMIPKTSKVIEIPVNDKYKIDVLYISKNKAVDKAIKKFRLVTHDINTER